MKRRPKGPGMADRLFLRNKGEDFRDRTSDARICGRDQQGKFLVSFDPRRELFRYHSENVAFVKSESLSLEGIFLLAEGKPLDYAVELHRLSSQNCAFGTRYEVVSTASSGKTYAKVYLPSDIEKKESALNSSLVRYLKSVAEATKPDTPNEDIREYLPRQFGRLRFLEGTPADRVAHPEKAAPLRMAPETIIYPFGSNLSQMEAVDKALSNQLSLIEGPPGTGKTQTILNIIANLIMQDKTVLVTSPNNEATKNVFDKLSEEGFGFIVALLGRRDNVKAFVESQERAYPPALAEWSLSKKKQAALGESIRKNTVVARDLYTRKQDLAKQETRLQDLELEYTRFMESNVTQSLRRRRRSTSKRIRAARDLVGTLSANEGELTFADRARIVWAWGIGTWHDFDHVTVDTEINLNRMLFEAQIDECKAVIKSHKTYIKMHRGEGRLEDITSKSKRLFEAKLYERYTKRLRSGRPHFDNPWDEPFAFRAEYPIITSTTNAARNQIGRQGDLFDYVIIDESSQADLVTGFLALAAAKNAVVVGDSKQLPCVIDKEEARKARPLFRPSGLPRRYSFVDNSLLDCLNACKDQSGLQAPGTLLKEHYRCHPDIIGFCNQQFYDGELIIMSDNKGHEASEVLSCNISKDLNYDRRADFNRVQAGAFEQEVLPGLKKRFKTEQIGVVSPYCKQVEGMKHGQKERPDGVTVATAHKFQGREKSAIVFVTRSNASNRFIDNPNLVNVAVSRAKDFFCLIAAPKVVEAVGNIADLKRYIEYHGGETRQSDVCSAFDLVYPCMKEERKAYLLDHGFDEHDEYSEARTCELIDEALESMNATSQIGYIRNYPLKQIFTHLELFDAEELRFISTTAHADFIFYRTIDKSFVLEFEINGSQHDRKEQIRRDKTKSGILRKAHIPQVVIRTNEELEEAKTMIRKALEKALKAGTDSERYLADREALSVAIKTDEEPWHTSSE